MTPYEALIAAEEKAGSQTELARICGCSQPAIWKMLNSSKRLSHAFVLQVETATGISRHDLRPDIYPRTVLDAPRRRSEDDELTPWQTGDYGNQYDILDYTGGAVL